MQSNLGFGLLSRVTGGSECTNPILGQCRVTQVVTAVIVILHAHTHSVGAMNFHWGARAKAQESGGRKSPSGVQEGSPVDRGGLDDQVPQKQKQFADTV